MNRNSTPIIIAAIVAAVVGAAIGVAVMLTTVVADKSQELDNLTVVVADKNQELDNLTVVVADKSDEIENLSQQLASRQQGIEFWEQLTALMMPVTLSSMTDHRAYMLPSGVMLALHFDNMNLAEAQNLNWVALGIPGTFDQEDQERIENLFGEGFTHFHDLMNDTHGGAPGAQGVWFVHIAAREFDAPWGHLEPGVDLNFMPTPPPQ